MNKKCIVTGGAGFIGSTLVDYLINQGRDVIVLDNLSTGSKQNIHSKAHFIHCDLSAIDQNELNYYFADVDTVFHCAALPNVQYSIEFPYKSNKANTDTTIKVLEAIRLNKISKIIYSSSCAVYGDTINIPTSESESIKPISPYALQKYIGEEYCHLYHKLYNINYTIFRYFNVYGERMTTKGAYVSVLSHFLQSLKNDQPLNIVNDGNQKRDFVYVGDVVRANFLASINDYSNNITFNIGSGINYSINTIADWFGLNKQYGETRIEPYETLSDVRRANFILNWYPEQSLETWVKNQI